MKDETAVKPKKLFDDIIDTGTLKSGGWIVGYKGERFITSEVLDYETDQFTGRITAFLTKNSVWVRAK